MNITKKNQPVIAQIPVSYSKSSEYRELVKVLGSKGYEVYHGLEAIEDDDDIIAIIVDNVDKSLFQSNVTCMACWCSGKRQPLNVKEFLSNMDILIDDPDPALYREMIRRKMELNNQIDLTADSSRLLIPHDYVKPDYFKDQGKFSDKSGPFILNRKYRKE